MKLVSDRFREPYFKEEKERKKLKAMFFLSNKHGWYLPMRNSIVLSENYHQNSTNKVPRAVPLPRPSDLRGLYS